MALKFRAELQVPKFATQIQLGEKLLLIGSCFTEQIGNYLIDSKFPVLQNPNGILFNPKSIVEAITSYVHNQKFTLDDLFYYNELWGSWKHHSQYSHPNKTDALTVINENIESTHQFLKTTDWLIITLGSAFVYYNVEDAEDIFDVANCHKMPAQRFERRILNSTESVHILNQIVSLAKQINLAIKIIFTISPVRHLREGFVENNRSKATLIQAVHEVVNEQQDIFYFPSYELIIDDLRDYRYFAEDLAHPNYFATQYVWEKFVASCMSEQAQQFIGEIKEIKQAVAHKPFHPTSAAHQNFLKTTLAKITYLQKKYPQINFEGEQNIVLSQLQQ